MKRQWQVTRQFQTCADGQRRWDRAFQLLLEWTAHINLEALMRIAVYLRVSTTRQMQDQTIAQQLERLQGSLRFWGKRRKMSSQF